MAEFNSDLVDYDCIIFDGHCDCPMPVYTNCKKYGNKQVTTVFRDGYWWVEFPDEAWNKAEFLDHWDGIPIYVKR